ncbi:MAG TPA: NADH:flavin oxidoreductase, partial [Microscillaceae bacterium]|nr:NADH:flavin oxidoreductase [Microscillaceae bacterium]
MNNNLNTPVTFACGKTMKNRFMLAPLTNKQSHEDGSLSDVEYHWLAKRAEGQFGLVMTCATSVQANGKCWSGQLGIYDDRHLPGHQRLVQKIQEQGSLAVTQLHHGGMRSDEALTGEKPVGPSDNEAENVRGLSIEEVEQLRDDFIAAAVRAQKAGYDGAEVHGAHGYMLTQFISKEINQRSDHYGGSLENRSRLLFEVVQGIREACGKAFLLGVRLSPERFGMEPQEIKTISQQLIDSGW